MTNDELPVATTGLVKTFGPTRALDGLDLTVNPGEIVGFLGPNGAGKTTAIRILLGLLRADAGEARIFGQDTWQDAVDLHRRIAYVPGDVSLWPNLTGGEAIDLLARLRGPANSARKAELIDRFDLDPTKKARTYSKGNRQKVALVSALSSDAELLILDEPTSGLDPLMEATFTEELRAAKDRGQSVLLSSHILPEVEKVCDRVTIIRAGRVVESGTLTQLRHLTRSTVTAILPDAAAANWVAHLPGVHEVVAEPEGALVRLRCDVDAEAMPQVLSALGASQVQGFAAGPPSLEDLFLRHYGDVL